MKDLKEKLKGTCVLNESVEMGAEIVKLYMEAGFYNGEFNYVGKITSYYYGDKDGFIRFSPDKSTFDKVLTLDQLRSIVRGEKEKPLFKIDYSTNCTAEEKLEIERMFMEAYNKSKNAPKVILNSSEGIARPISESVEFKEGEMVEHKFINSDWIADGIIFTGGRTSQGLFVCEDKHGMLRCVEQIRKIDPDPHGFLKTANEIISERIQHKPFDEDSVRDMLIEMAKRVKK